MIEVIQNIDKDLFLYLNGIHNSFFDQVMFWISNKYIWIPLYLLLAYLVYRYYGWKVFWVLIFAAILITISDLMSVHLFKNVFQRLRPCHDPELTGMVHLVKDHCGGQYGLISSHASNSFAIAVFISGVLRKHIKWITPLLICWALLISYSRIYLGVHYPGDVLGGIVAGSVLGYICFLIFNYINKSR